MTYMITRQERTARARADDAQVSTKQCIMIAKFLRGKQLDVAIATLERVMEKEQAVPFTRFTNGLGHKPGVGAGRYPIKAAAEFRNLLENVKVNATNIGLTGTLKITHIAANRASRPMRNRLKYRGEFKRSNLEVVVTEVEDAAKKDTKRSKSAASRKQTAKAKPAPADKTEKKVEQVEKKLEKDAKDVKATEKKVKQDEKKADTMKESTKNAEEATHGN